MSACQPTSRRTCLELLRSPSRRVIPVLGVPIINEIANVLMLVESIDHPIGTLHFLHNADVGQLSAEVRRALLQARSAHVQRILISAFPVNMGVAAAWNVLFSYHRSAPFVLVSNADVSFRPGALLQISHALALREKTVRNGCAIFSFGLGLSLFAMSNASFERLGHFDENFWPAYSEDCDYLKRLSLTSPRCIEAQLPLAALLRHFGSAASRRAPEESPLRQQTDAQGVQQRFFNNRDLLRAKWGAEGACDAPATRCPYGRRPVSGSCNFSWTLDWRRRKARGGPNACFACARPTRPTLLLGSTGQRGVG